MRIFFPRPNGTADRGFPVDRDHLDFLSRGCARGIFDRPLAILLHELRIGSDVQLVVRGRAFHHARITGFWLSSCRDLRRDQHGVVAPEANVRTRTIGSLGERRARKGLRRDVCGWP